MNATFGNSGTGSAGGAPTLFGGAANGEYMNESYADYIPGIQPTRPTTLANQLGAYGFYDGVAWAVLDHTGFSDATNTLVAGTNEFAVIPETRHMGHGRGWLRNAHRNPAFPPQKELLIGIWQVSCSSQEVV